MSLKRSAQQGFTSSRRSAQQGFTLIELLVALSIFAILAASGVMLLGNAVSAQGQMAQRLEEQGGMLRVVSLLEQDLAQAVPRVSRTENGLLAPAFYSRAPSQDEPFLQFVRGGVANLDDSPRASLQKVEYWLREGRLERRTYPMLDGAQGDIPAMLIDNLEDIELGFRNESGEWLEQQWQSAKPLAMPIAMRMIIRRVGAPPLTLLFRVGTGQLNAAQQGQGGDV
tara:strand:- start:9618 stop:10295 length:678 start_codon:yes stop_codon:yes gene_type:complete